MCVSSLAADIFKYSRNKTFLGGSFAGQVIQSDFPFLIRLHIFLDIESFQDFPLDPSNVHVCSCLPPDWPFVT